MQAVINICDEGIRLRPLSCVRNPALVRVGRLSVLEHMIRLLSCGGCEKIIIISSYMSEGVRVHLKEADRFGAELVFLTHHNEKEALTACAKKINGDFIYISGPLYAAFDIKEAIQLHKKRNAFLTLITPHGICEGIASDKRGRVTRVEEARLWSSVSGDSGTGVYILKPSAVHFAEGGGFTRKALGDIVRSGREVYIKATKGPFEPVCDTASYMRACFAFLEGMKKTANGGIVVEEGAVVEKGALLEVPCYIGKNAHIHKGAKIGAFSLIGEGSVIAEGASIKRSILGKDCRVGAGASLRGCILDEEVHLGRSTTVYEQAIVGRRCSVAGEVLIKSFVKIWPEKRVEKGVIVSENIMWGQKKRSRLFEEGKIEGVVNVDITPLFCTLLGSVAGRLFASGAVGVSTDDSASGAMLRDAIVSGLMGSGCTVKDFGEQPLPITRRAVAFYSLKGAVALSVQSVSGEEVCRVSIMGKHGFDIEDNVKAKLEEMFEKGEVVYPEAKSVKECEYVFEYKLYYLKSFVDYKRVKRKGLRVLLSCPATWGRRLITSSLSDFESTVSMYEGDADTREGRLDFASAVHEGNFDLGFMLSGSCEKLYVVYKGRLLTDDMYEALCALVVMKQHKGAKIYVPCTSTGAIDKLAEKYNCSVVRTKSTSPDIMRHMAGDEGYLTKQFVFRFDAVGSVILLMDYLTGTGEDLGDLISQIPPIAMERAVVDMPHGRLNAVMEKISRMPEAEDSPEGVKITFDKGWVMVIPDREKEVFRLCSEGVSMEAAKELCDFCIRTIDEK